MKSFRQEFDNHSIWYDNRPNRAIGLKDFKPDSIIHTLLKCTRSASKLNQTPCSQLNRIKYNKIQSGSINTKIIKARFRVPKLMITSPAYKLPRCSRWFRSDSVMTESRLPAIWSRLSVCQMEFQFAGWMFQPHPDHVVREGFALCFVKDALIFKWLFSNSLLILASFLLRLIFSL